MVNKHYLSCMFEYTCKNKYIIQYRYTIYNRYKNIENIYYNDFENSIEKEYIIYPKGNN